MASLKHPPKVSDSEVQLAINKIYDEINTLIDAVNSSSDETSAEGSGKSGDIRVSKKSNRRVAIEVRTDEGWFESQVFKDEPNLSVFRNLTGGTSSDTIAEVPIAYNGATLANALSSITDKIIEIVAILNEMNPNAFKMIEKRR